jgi:hypothetical protein
MAYVVSRFAETILRRKKYFFEIIFYFFEKKQYFILKNQWTGCEGSARREKRVIFYPHEGFLREYSGLR